MIQSQMTIQSLSIVLLSLSFVIYFGKSATCSGDKPYRCGSTWSQANGICGQCCYDDSHCTAVSGEDKCYANLDESPCAAVAPTPPSTIACVLSVGRCGSTWLDANSKCGQCCNTPQDCVLPGDTNCFGALSQTPCQSLATPTPTTATPAPTSNPTSITSSPTHNTPSPTDSTSVTSSVTHTPTDAPTNSNALRNNRIRSSTPPSQLPLSEIPMFLTITFDDALHQDSFSKTSSILNHQNRNGEQIPLVYYISNEWSDYSLIQQRYLQGCEIAIHTVSHTTNKDSSLTKWYYEIKESRELISTHCDIPINEIIGFRAPFLEKSDNMFRVLNGITPSYSYDSTIISRLNSANLFDWPYTLNKYESDLVYHPGEGPKKSYPGLWEIPMYYLYNNIANKEINTIMDYGGGYNLFDTLKANFNYRYNTNKSPMGIYFHANHLSVDTIRALNDFIEWVLDKNDSWIVTNKQVIEWMNNPISKQIYEPKKHNGLSNGKTHFNECSYTEFLFKTVSTCPLTMPHSMSWDESVVIPNAEVIITTNPNNIITNSQYICTDDIYTNYESNKIYCNPNDGVLVMYNNVLYECQWWTQGQNPATNAAWKLVKTCIVYTNSFVKGSIVPFATIDVFIDSILRIDIEPYSAEQTFDISVNGADLTTVFDTNDYILITNNDGSVQLTITFAQISVSEYNIQILFH